MNAYQTLGITPAASRDEIDQAYRRKTLACHPDRPGGSHAAMSAINAAYRALTDRSGHSGPPPEVITTPDGRQVVPNRLEETALVAEIARITTALATKATDRKRILDTARAYHWAEDDSRLLSQLATIDAQIAEFETLAWALNRCLA